MRTSLYRSFWVLLLLAIVYFGTIFYQGWSSDWQPEGVTPLALTQNAATTVVTDSVLSVLIWNVGYGGLGAQSDLFYDDEGMWYSGTSMVRSPRPLVNQYVAGAVNCLKATKADFFLLQEVDVESKRSYNIRQYDLYCAALPDYAATMAENYRCERVSIPLLEPWHFYGKVQSGLGTFSRFQPAVAERHQLPGQYPMPDRIFQLDRCVALHRFPTNRGHDLVVLNLHNSAYDPGDKIKAIQLPYLRDLAQKEYEKGNYVVLAGDWNQCPPYFRFETFMPDKVEGNWQGNIPADFFPEDWMYAYDPTTPTNRKSGDIYTKGTTFETLIDFAVVSPNIKIKTVKGLRQDFQWSDHQPVWIEFLLK